MLVRPLCTTCCFMLTTLLYHVLVPGRFAKRRCWGLRFCTCASQCSSLFVWMSGGVFPDVGLDTQIDQSIFRKRCLLFLLYMLNVDYPIPLNLKPTHPLHYLNSVNFRRVSCSICDCDVRLQYLWLLVGCMHFGKADVKMCHGHPWSKHGLLFHTIYFPTQITKGWSH